MSIDRISSNITTPRVHVAENSNLDRPQLLPVVNEPIVKEPVTNEHTSEISKEKLERVVKGMNEFLQPTKTSLKFEMHEELKEFYVKIVDSVTQEVVKEIPSKKILDMYAEMTRFLGLVVDKKI
jgi:flagellar protein FlaG